MAKIERQGNIFSPIRPEEILRAGDRLIFVGMIHSIQELREIPDLKLASDIHYSPQEDQTHNILVEAVVSHSSPILNKSIRDSNFRSLYNAVVLAVHRNGERIESKIGDIHLRAGDTLLLDAHGDFISNHQHSRDFYLASKIEEKKTVNLQNTLITSLTLLTIVIIAAFRPSLLFILSLSAIPFLRALKCLNLSVVQKAIDWQILALIGCAFGIGKALETSGAAQILSDTIIQGFQTLGPLGLLIGIYVVTLVLTSIMTNIAAVVIMFPLTLVKANYLASPPLVVAFALAGTVDIDLTKEPIGESSQGEKVYLKDIWPSSKEIHDVIQQTITSHLFQKSYKDVFKGSKEWNELGAPSSDLFQWRKESTYIQEPPFFKDLQLEPAPFQPIQEARVLVMVGDSVTTDHISPAGFIHPESPAGNFLIENNIAVKDFNSYGSRRGNDRVMTRGTFANVRLRNLLAPGTGSS